MKPLMRLTHVAAVIAIFSVAAMPAMAGDLALKRVMLSAGGVAYLEHEAEVTDNAELTLDVPLGQVDDVLKSIVVYDNKGGVGSAQLAGRDPLSQIFNDLPFAADTLTSPAALLNALQGAEIKVGASKPIVGRLLQVVPETVQLGDRGTLTRNRVSVLTSTGLQQFMLEDADSVSFVDPALQAQVDKALSEIATHRAKDRRQIVLKIQGNGTRTLRVGYVVAASLWKANYRVTLPQDLKADKAHLQGWAVLENMSGQDWKGVELTLLSGNPVSFRQAIYEAYYVTRPEVPVEVLGRVLPKPDTGVLASEQARSNQEKRSATEYRDRTQVFHFGGGTSFGGEPAEAPKLQYDRAPSALTGKSPDADQQLISRALGTAEAEEGATQVSFRIPTAIRIGSGQSALVPIVERDLPIERLALLQFSTSTARPFASLRLRNDTAFGLPPGVLTIYEQTGAGMTYVGDARLAPFPVGESRLVSYAVDEKTKVAQETQSTWAISKAAIAQGVLTLTRTQRQMIVYRITAPATEDRRLIIEYPKSANWTLVEPAKAELTASTYRITVDLKAGEAKTVTIRLEAPVMETLSVANMEGAQIAAVTSTDSVAPAVKSAFAELARLRRVVDDKKTVEADLHSKLEALQSDQSRIRDNIGKIGPDSALYKRYLEKLAEQETQFETLQAAAAKAAADTQAARASVDAFIAKMTI
ncbi:DUF4139 domain-containing protein [Bradyrhizobium ontarionense]|uniref:DUF4139 domain-containing protein n=1 Tax=Bradyrhizobium ontarionense TaxID=2898149 RepID=A0ABY3R5C9_9BRAD|nr:DUF4139 domain-containing protein [Bradyrhizobium sp. A19]UFZ02510.1 DUF4139 domain-containing protein [Bradyrhizobium sp. A19]